MSVQLIVFPQSYNGLSPLSGIGTECVVDGINFNTVNTSASATSLSGNLPQDYISGAGTFNVNTWYRFSGTGSAATEISGNLIFVVDKGILQRLSNLSVGALYNVTIEFSALNAAGINFYHYSGTTQQSVTTITGITTQTFTFTAQSATDTIVLYGLGATSVASISVKKASIGSSGVSLSNGQVICDLYEDESIPLSLSVDDFKNAAEQVKSYSKAFQLPATKRNNRIFDNIFEITRADDGVIFNPYIKTQCTLKQDGFVLFEGYLRMIDISDKEGELSYNVNLYSEVVALADVLGERTFSELDLKELVHTYNKTNIKNSWYDGGAGISYTNAGTSGFRNNNDTVKYPFINWTNQIPIAAAGGIPNAGMPQLTSYEQAFRPCIQIKYLIDRIFNQPNFPFSYTSAFFNTADFEKLYMDFNWGSATAPNNNIGQGEGENDNTTGVVAGSSFTRLVFDVEDFSNASELGFDISTSEFTASFDNQQYWVNTNFVIAYENWSSGTAGTVAWQKLDASGGSLGFYGIFSLNPLPGATFGNKSYNKTFTATLDTGESIRPVFQNDQTGSGVILTQRTSQQLSFTANNTTTVTTGTSSTTSTTLIQNLRGELGQWEFLKGIFTMFNLVSVPDSSDPNNIIIEPYNDMFLENADSSELNWTDKIDIEEMKLKPLTELNRTTIFKFAEDDDDFAFQNYKNQVGGHLYGSQMWDAQTSGNGLATLFTGEEEIVAEPFAATVPKPLMAQYPELIVPAIYAYNPDDNTSEGFDNSPRIMYNLGVKTLANMTYYIPSQNCSGCSENATVFGQFAHLSTIPTTPATLDFHFGECQLIPPIGNPTTNNLFNTYWLPYFNDLYNPDTRTMTIKVDLSSGDINTFKFYDIVMIKNRKFRVNKIEYQPNDLSTVEFILIP